MDNSRGTCPILLAASTSAMATLRAEPALEQFKMAAERIGDDCAWWDDEQKRCSVQKGV